MYKKSLFFNGFLIFSSFGTLLCMDSSYHISKSGLKKRHAQPAADFESSVAPLIRATEKAAQRLDVVESDIVRSRTDITRVAERLTALEAKVQSSLAQLAADDTTPPAAATSVTSYQPDISRQVRREMYAILTPLTDDVKTMREELKTLQETDDRLETKDRWLICCLALSVAAWGGSTFYYQLTSQPTAIFMVRK